MGNKNRELVEGQIAAANVDPSLDPARVAELSEAFAHFDQDRSGRLNRLEMASCLGSLGMIEISFDGEDPTFQNIWTSMAMADDDSESVGMDAFMDYMSAAQGDGMNPEQLRDSFKQVAGGADTITADDLSRNGVAQDLVQFIQENVQENDGAYDYNAYLNE